ncbi:MAG: hypothetical protein K6347_08300 [Campylobacterales bacterium]
MNASKHQVMIVVFLLFVGTFSLLWLATEELKDTIAEQARENQYLRFEGEQIRLLKEKWENKNRIKAEIEQFATHPKLTKNESKGNRHLMEFSGVAPDEVNDLANKLLNSLFVIRTLEIKRTSAETASIVVEFDQ